MPGRVLRIHNVQANEEPLLVLKRKALTARNQVYFHIANRTIPYPLGRNRIIYIGTTQRGIERVLSSIGERAAKAFSTWGVDMLEVHRIGCKPVQRVKTWKKLESASIIAFREEYGRIPKLNKHGEKYRKTDEFEYFNRDEIVRFLKHWEHVQD